MKKFWSFLGILLLTGLVFQAYFMVRIACMRWTDPSSTTWQRTEIYRLINRQAPLKWRHDWMPYGQISTSVKRAIITSEDDSFLEHTAVDWRAVQMAWSRNEMAMNRFERQMAKAEDQSNSKNSKRRVRPATIAGGSTITQQIAKNLFLSGDKNLFRKAQELVFAYELEFFLSKQRIFEIYLNSVEWGAGIFGIDAAAQHYFHKPASRLSNGEAAILAVMLPQPLYLQWHLDSQYVQRRSRWVLTNMLDAQIP